MTKVGALVHVINQCTNIKIFAEVSTDFHFWNRTNKIYLPVVKDIHTTSINLYLKFKGEKCTKQMKFSHRRQLFLKHVQRDHF